MSKPQMTEEEEIRSYELRKTSWTHLKSGNHYIIQYIARMESDNSWVVVYSQMGASANIFVRPLDEFMDGRFERLK